MHNLIVINGGSGEAAFGLAGTHLGRFSTLTWATTRRVETPVEAKTYYVEYQTCSLNICLHPIIFLPAFISALSAQNYPL